MARIIEAMAEMDNVSGGVGVVRGDQVVVVGEVQVIFHPKFVKMAMQSWFGGQNGDESVSVQISESQ